MKWWTRCDIFMNEVFYIQNHSLFCWSFVNEFRECTKISCLAHHKSLPVRIIWTFLIRLRPLSILASIFCYNSGQGALLVRNAVEKSKFLQRDYFCFSNHCNPSCKIAIETWRSHENPFHSIEVMDTPVAPSALHRVTPKIKKCSKSSRTQLILVPGSTVMFQNMIYYIY